MPNIGRECGWEQGRTKVYRNREEVYIGQGYGYTLPDQDAFCLAQGRAACSETTTGVGNKTALGGGLQVWSKKVCFLVLLFTAN